MDIKKLEFWYQKNHRKLSFRETRQPYHIWISEIMLQQTQVDTVLPFFERFIKKYPTVFELANTTLDDLRKTVEGIGYYRRFKLMHEAAQVIVEKYHGVFPNNYDEVIALPGIGSYTAGAIMSIAYNKPYSALDGNVIRVLSRYYGIDDDFRIEKNRKKLNQKNQEIIMHATPNIYTQALMELGAIICRPYNPDCNHCPIQEHCVAFHQDLTEKLPYLSKLSKPKEISYITLIIQDEQGAYYLRKRNEKLLEGMYEFPQYEAESIDYVCDMLNEEGISIIALQDLGDIKHVFSHQVWHMHIYRCVLKSKPHDSWEKIQDYTMDHVPMAVAHRKITVLI
ncbi:MAG: A/G-specific adenine glycosylase [Bacillota bacterium]|nr:MAG: A/G-specific adenine glycosylase [Bacillota bacterium]